MPPARLAMPPHIVRRLSVVIAVAMLIALLPFTTDTARAGYEITNYPGEPGTIVARTGDDLIPSYRYHGENRFDTAHLIAEDTDTLQADPSDALATSDVVLLARADTFPDALAGAYLAGLETAPLLLVSTSGDVDEHTWEALRTIDPERVFLLGGPDAISSDVFDQLDNDYAVRRIEGANRYITAAEIAREGADDLPNEDRVAFVASGEVAPDALVAGSLSYAAGLPLLLTRDDSLPEVTVNALNDLAIDRVLLLGGTQRIATPVQEAIEAQDIDVERVFGDTRVGTATALARIAVDRYGFTADHVNFARGDHFADALAMGPHAGEEQAVQLLTWNSDVFDRSGDNADFLDGAGCVQVVHIAGGPAAITGDTEQDIRRSATNPCALTLEPAEAENLVGSDHTVTATVTGFDDGPFTHGAVTFTVDADDGSEATPEPASGTVDLGSDGMASFTFTSTNPGAVTITACADDVCDTATKTFGTDAFVEGLAIEDLMGHLQALQDCADDVAGAVGTGDREASSLGYQCSVDYIRDALIAAGYPEADIEETAFNYVLWDEVTPGMLQIGADAPLSTDDPEPQIDLMTYAGSTGGTPITGPLVEVNDNIVPMPADAEPSTSNAGCEPEDFADADFTGAVAVIQRGTCDFAVKAANAVEAGAIGVIVFNEGQTDRQDVVLGTLGDDFPYPDVPVFGVSYQFGVDLVTDRLGETASLTTETTSSEQSSSNLILSIPGSDPQGAIMSGAHLDSVPGGEGINDNGSGSVGILEIALQMADAGIQPRNDTYFAWWGAEEHGLVGSTCFVEGGCGGDLEAGRVVDFTLAEPDYTDLGYALLEGGYLNYDMIASPNFMRGIYDGDGGAFDIPGPEGSAAIEAAYEAFFDARDLAHQGTEFSGRSDYFAFISYDIAAGGLFTGAEDLKTDEEVALYGGEAGEQYDPNYHDPNDDMYNGWPSGSEPNINEEVFLQNTGAAANSALLFAMSLDSLADTAVEGASASGARSMSRAGVGSTFSVAAR